MDIFGRATLTNVWLGSRGATLSHEGLRKFCREYDHVMEGNVNDETLMSQVGSNDSIVSQRIDRITSELCKNGCNGLRALKTFCTHPWFERAWVVQEVVTSSKVTVHWEGGRCQWLDIGRTCLLLKLITLRTSLSPGRLPIAATSQFVQAKDSLRVIVDQSCNPPWTKPLIDLIRDILSHGKTKATQPEDLVYSVIGIASDAATCGIEVDYDKHYSEVFREAALLHLKTLGAQALAWSCQEGRNRHPDSCRLPVNCRLPSWVPDLALRTRGSLIGISQADRDLPKIFSAAGKSMFEYNVDGKSDILCVRTSYTDRVIEVSKLFEISMQVYEPGWNFPQQHQAWLKDYERFLDAVADRNPTRYDLSTRQDMRWRIPIADYYVDEKGFRRAGPEVKDWYMATLHPDGASSASSVNNSRKYSRSFYLADRVAFSTETGYIGLGHPDTVIGDELHLIQGSDTPFILRKSDGRYELVGEAYVHGIMDGELVDDTTEFEWLQLH